MCGICGFIVAEKKRGEHNYPVVLKEMVATLEHRGPDEAGQWYADGVGIGMRRLSIIDRAGGQQPLWNEDHTVGVVFNGEIYNYRELRGELEDAGHRFATRCDTEVIVHAYEQWGRQCVERLNGMFGLAVLDRPRKSLFLARDRMGIKPLYYCRLAGAFLFASEMKALRPFPLWQPELDPQAVLKFTLLGFTPTPLTQYRGVRKVPPGYSLVLNFADGLPAAEPEPYWTIPFGEPLPGSADDLREQFGELLRDAVRRRLMSEVPLGVLLSGGIDSSVITSLVRECRGERIATFSMRFREPFFDEGDHSRTVARHVDTDHHEVQFTPGDFADFPRFMSHMEELSINIAAAYPMYHLAKFIKERGYTVLLSGQGADELLCGYPWFGLNQTLEQINQHPYLTRTVVKKFAACQKAFLILKHVPVTLKNLWILNHVDEPPVVRYYGSLCPWFNIPAGLSLLPDFFNPDWLPVTAVDPSVFRDPLLEAEGNGLPLIEAFQLCEFRRRLTDFILFEMDRFSMAHSLEYRVPFLDHRLVEFCVRLPAAMKVQDDREKIILRDWASDRLPPAIWQRKKKGFQSRVTLYDGAWPEWLEELLDPFAVKQAGCLNFKTVSRARREYAAGNENMLLPLIFATNIQLANRF